MSPTFNPQKPDPSHPTHHTEKPSASGHHNEPSYHHPALSAYRRQSIPSAGSTLDPDIPPDLARQVRRDSMSEVQKESEYIQRHFRQPKMDSRECCPSLLFYFYIPICLFVSFFLSFFLPHARLPLWLW